MLPLQLLLYWSVFQVGSSESENVGGSGAWQGGEFQIVCRMTVSVGLEAGVDAVEGVLRRVIVFAEVAEPHLLEVMPVAVDEFCGVGVAQMAAVAADALFEEGRIETGCQHALVVVGFYDELIGGGHVVFHFSGDVAGVGDEAERVGAVAQEIAHVVVAVVGHVEGCNLAAAACFGLSFVEKHGVGRQGLVCDGGVFAYAFVGVGCGIEREGVSGFGGGLLQCSHVSGVVTVVVCHEDGAQP